MMDEEPDMGAELTALRDRNGALERQIADIRAARLQAELKAEAVRAGIVDLDGLQLLPPGSVTIDEQGAVHGAPAAIGRLRTEKPWLFAQSSSSSTAAAPPSAPAAAKHAADMSNAEWRSARAELLKRR